MRKYFLGYLLTISFTLLLASGCAKDQVKPDEGIAGDTAAAAEASSGSQTAAQQQQTAAQKAALDQMAANKAAQDKAAAQKLAQEQADAERIAREKAEQAAQQAALERTRAGQIQTEQSADSSASEAAAKASLQRIHFDFDSYVLRQEARDILYNNADYLLKKYRGKIQLEGHCDERGSDEYNLALGENRAKSAMNYLITLGVPAQQLSIISYGKERPLDPAQTEEAWAKNRRVEFEIVK